MNVKEVELTTLWGRVIEEVAINAPQHRAFLQLTKPLGLLHNDDQTTLLVAAPNLFAKDVLESRLRTVVSEVLTRELGSTTNIAVTVDETLEVVSSPTPDVEVEFVTPKTGMGRDDAPVSKTIDTSTLNPRYIFETFVIGALAGAIGATAIGCLYVALKRGPMGIVSPITAVMSAAIPVFFGLLNGKLIYIPVPFLNNRTVHDYTNTNTYKF